jgi:DNA repair protein RecO (recombination protein O)
MRQFRTRGIVLRRVNYGEADRIITFLTPDYGLVGAMVKGVRKQGSKLAGGIELFSESDLTFVKGKGDLDHLISSRLITHYRHIINDYQRVELGYDAIAVIERAARHMNEGQFYVLLVTVFEGLDDSATEPSLVEGWFKLNLLRILGQQPNLTHDTSGAKLQSNQTYTLLPDDGAFAASSHGDITAEHIKAWRVMVTSRLVQARKISGVSQAIAQSLPAIRHLFEYQFGA